MAENTPPTRTVISRNVECPWCGAAPGEDCHEADGNGGKRPLLWGRGHLARVEEVPDVCEITPGTNHEYGCVYEGCARFAVRRVMFWHPGLGFVDPDDYCWEHSVQVLSENAGVDARSEPIHG